jgi:acyl-[acyl-carrier-protein] desaturase
VQSSELLLELDSLVGQLFERHQATTREWFPHELVPYSRGRDFVPGEEWTPEQAACGGAALSESMRSALFVNLLTEDNLPYYFRDLERMFGTQGNWATWARWWTAEEGRHSIVLRDYLTVTRALDPRELERGRMAQVSGGEAPAPVGPHHGLVYLCLQELATRISHRNTGRLMGDAPANELMTRIAFDENLHYLFYRDLAIAALALDPSTMVQAIDEIVCNFAMPGVGIPAFEHHSARIANAGIYDLQIHHEQILVPVVLRLWKLESLTGLTDEAERARDHALAHIERVGRVGRALAKRRDARTAADARTTAEARLIAEARLLAEARVVERRASATTPPSPLLA